MINTFFLTFFRSGLSYSTSLCNYKLFYCLFDVFVHCMHRLRVCVCVCVAHFASFILTISKSLLTVSQLILLVQSPNNVHEAKPLFKQYFFEKFHCFTNTQNFFFPVFKLTKVISVAKFIHSTLSVRANYKKIWI